jgi:hypothetical protein
MAIPRDFLQSIYEDADSFGGDALYQNEMLANIINPPMPIAKPAPQLIAPVTEGSDSVAKLFASQSAAPAELPAPLTFEPVMKDIFGESDLEVTKFTQPSKQPTVAPASPTVAPTTPSPAAPTAPKVDYTSALTKQILGQGITDKWSGAGHGSAEANAADMAKILAGIGITDIKQFGKVPQYARAEVKMGFNGQLANQDADGNYYITVPGGTDSEGNQIMVPQYLNQSQLKPIYGTYSQPMGMDENPQFVPIDPTLVIEKDGVPMIKTGETFGNKATGQAVPNTYTERQTGNFFGGTYEGKGNTGYGVQFDAQGNPYFYTQGASSSDMDKIAPLLSIASFIPGLAPFAQGLNALIAVKQGNLLGAALSTLGAAGGAGFTDFAGIPIGDAKNILGGINALQTGNVAGLINSAAGYAGASLPSEFNTGVKVLNAANAYSKGDYAGLLDAASSLTGSSDAKLAASALRLTNAVNSGNPAALLSAAQAFGSIVNTASADPKLALGFGPGDPDEFIASLIPGYFQPGGEGYIPPEEEDPTTVQQKPAGLDDFLSQLEQFKQSAVTPDDIQEIISGQNFARPEDIQNAISNIPAGLTEEDLAQSLGMTKEDLLTQLGTTEEGLQQRIADLESEFGGQLTGATQGLESKIAGTQDSVDALAESLGTTKDDLLKELGVTEEGLQQRIADLESEFGGQLSESTKGIESKITGLEEDFSAQLAESLGTTKEDLLNELGITEEGLQQRIADLESEFGGQLTESTKGLESKLAETQTGVDELAESLGTTREDLLDQLGVTEDEINQRIADLESEFGGSFKDIESSLGKTREDLLAEFGLSEEEMQQRISDLETKFGGNFEDIESSLGKTREELLSEFGVTEDEINQRIADLETEFGGNFGDIESSLEKTREDLLAEFGLSEEEMQQRIADLETTFGGNLEDIESSLGKTREELLAEFGVTEDEINQRIADLETEFGGNFEDIEGSLEKTREELLAEFGLSEEEMAKRIADLETEFGGQLTSGLGKQSAETKALFQNLLNQQQSQAAALAKSQAAAAAKAKADAVARAQSEAAASKNNQLQALLAMMSSNNEVAKIKSYKDLFGEDLFGTDIDLTPIGGEAE